MKTWRTYLRCQECEGAAFDVPVNLDMNGFLATKPSCPKCGATCSIPFVTEVGADDLRTIFDVENDADRGVLRLLIARDALMFATQAYIRAFTQEDRFAAPTKLWWSVERMHLFTQVAGYLHEAMKAFDWLDKKDWFKLNLPSDAKHKPVIQDALDRLRKAVASDVFRQLALVRNKTSFHFDDSDIKAAFQALPEKTADLPVLVFNGTGRHSFRSPLGAELMSRIVVQRSDALRLHEFIVETVGCYCDLVDGTVGGHLAARGVAQR